MSSFNQLNCFKCGEPIDDLRCRWCTCEICGHDLRDGFCLFCNSSDRNSFIYDSNPNSFENPLDFSYQPPQPQYESYSCELCGNDSHYGYDFPPRFPLVYEQEPCYNQNFGEIHRVFHNNIFVVKTVGVLMKYPIDQSPPHEMSIQDLEDQKQQYLEEMLSISNQIQIKDYRNEKIDIRYRRECEIESTIPLNEISSQIPLSIAITPVLPNNEPEDSLIMGNEELSTIPEKESDEFIKSSVEDLVLIPSKSKDSSESDDDEPSEMIEDQNSIHHLSGSPTPYSDPVVASLSPSLTPTGDSDSIVEETDTLLPHHDSTSPEVDEDIFDPEGDIRLPPPHELNNEIFDPEGDILFLENLLKDDPSEAENSEVDSLIKEPSDTFLMRNEDIKLKPPMDVDNPVSIPRVSEKPLDPILETSKTTITDPLFDFYSEFTVNSDNPILDIQNKESDEFNTETIMDEVQINSTQNTAQIPPPYGKFSIDIAIPNLIVPFSRFRYGIFGDYHLLETLGPKLFSYLSYYLGLDFPKEYLRLVDENGIFDPGISIVYEFSSLWRYST
ncbi:hypothetical protein Tco_0487095 [Tanacetum coccineum]